MRKIMPSVFIKILLLSAGIEFVFQFLKCASWYPSLPSTIGELENVPISEFLFQWFICFIVLTLIYGIYARIIFESAKSQSQSDSSSAVEEFPNIVAQGSRKSFFDIAGWLSLIIPFVLTAITFGFILLADHANPKSLSPNFISGVLGCEFLIAVGSIILGAVSVLGVKRHKRRISLWIALAGILVSGIASYAAFILLALSGMGSNC
jgi:hypothetical protein